ncbi:MAG: hypothetical protein MUC41_16305 [Syntrophobacteraceae bacterium]|nr:hypothetical protein [Syntrophobacteraceae bacterium]
MKAPPADIQPVPLASVDWDDRRFAMESHGPEDTIQSSISRYGILAPPWVLEAAAGKVAIVDGFKRMRFLREREEREAVCAVFPSHVNPRELWAWRLEARLFGSPPNPAEKARVAAILADGPLEASSVSRLLEGFGLPLHPQSLARWTRLARSEPALLEAAARGIVHERAALELAGWLLPVEDRAGFISLLGHLRCSASIQVEIIEGFRDIGMMLKQPVGELLRCTEVRGILDQPDWSHREKTRAVREWLDEMRLPRLKARERLFKARLRRTPPPAGTTVAPPPSFEGSHWRLEVVFSSDDELRGRLGQLKAWVESDGVKALLTPELAGEPRDRLRDDP